jgi:hypothetical protein
VAFDELRKGALIPRGGALGEFAVGFHPRFGRRF